MTEIQGIIAHIENLIRDVTIPLVEKIVKAFLSDWKPDSYEWQNNIWDTDNQIWDLKQAL